MRQLSAEVVVGAITTSALSPSPNKITSLSPQEQRGVEEPGGVERGGVVRQLLGRVRRPQRELAV